MKLSCSAIHTGRIGYVESYSEFAEVYDIFMDNVDYDAWCAAITRILGSEGIRDGLVCELGCGTGTMTERLAAAGYDMIGIDDSPEMLQEAMEKKTESGHDILYLLQDMREFELYGTVRAIVSVCDCINYLTEKEDLLETFRLVNNYLDPGGLFLFDLNMAPKYEKIGNSTIAENRPEGSFIWENDYDKETCRNTYQLTLFIPEQENLYRKYEELHVQRAYAADEIRALLEEAGMEFLWAREGYTDRAASPDSERVWFAAREKGKRQSE
jgi:SAM-dependent methyltransferase